MTLVKTYMRAALALLLGERCVVCGRPLPGAMICPECLMKLPYMNIRGAEGNAIERHFWAHTPVVRASASLLYRPNFEIGQLLHDIKYRDRKDLAAYMGRLVAQEHLTSGFFDTIDAIQPIPLHPNRQRQRGFNQSECLAQGIAEVTGLPIVDLVRRTKDNLSQTHFEHAERRKNAEGIFEAVATDAPLPRHILILDDVITTGATCTSCAQALTGYTVERAYGWNGPRVSFLAMAYAGSLRLGRMTPQELKRQDHSVDNEEFRRRQYRSL